MILLMVNKEILKDRSIFVCKVCNFHYFDENVARKCEVYCESHGSCSNEITKNSVERSGLK